MNWLIFSLLMLISCFMMMLFKIKPLLAIVLSLFSITIWILIFKMVQKWIM